MTTAGLAFHRSDLRIVEIEVQTPNQLPYGSSAMVLLNQIFYIDCVQNKL